DPRDPSSPAGLIRVEAGARISIGNYGQALLAGGAVQNAGSIQAPDGQVLLLGGDGVSLAASTTPDLRGYVAQVSGGRPVSNDGMILVPRGNATLLGGCTGLPSDCTAVAQRGLISATSSGQANGSITLAAPGFTTLFGSGSVTQGLPDDGAPKVVGLSAADLQPSSITASGREVLALYSAYLYHPA